MDYIEKKINELLMENEKKNIRPLGISLNALYGSIMDDTKAELRKLLDSKKIKTFRSINDIMIRK